jgi:hypothetical protein
LTGYWLNTVTVQGRTVSIQEKFVQIGDDVEGSVFGTMDSWINGQISYKGRLSSNVVIGKSQDGSSTPANPHWVSENLYLDSPNKIRFQLSPLVLMRADVPAICTPEASRRVDPEIDYDKARSAMLKSKDFREAACWFRGAAEQGHARSEAFLAILLYTGNGVAQNHAEAVEWVRKSASQDDRVGRALAPRMTAQGGAGIPLKPDANGVYTWENIAAALDAPTPSGFTMRDALIGTVSMWNSADRDAYDEAMRRCNQGSHSYCVQASNMREFDETGPMMHTLMEMGSSHQ